MTRTDFLRMLKDGDLTKEQAREIVMDFAWYINHNLGENGLYDVSSLVAELRHASNTKDVEHGRVVDLIKLSLKRHDGLGYFTRTTGNHQLIIHWPSFFLAGITNPKSQQARMVWLLQSVLRRRSPLFFSLLRRKYLTELLQIDLSVEGEDGRFEDEDYRDVVPLDYEEVSLCLDLGKRIVSLPEVGEISNRSFLGMLISSGVRKAQNYDVLRLWKEGLTKQSPLFWETTLISRRRLNELRETLRAGGSIAVPDARIDRPGYGAAMWSKIMFDMLALPHFSTPDGRFGVYKVSLTEDNVPHMVVNVPKVVRQLAREDKYSRAAEIWKADATNPSVTEAMIRDRVCLGWGGQSPLLMENRLRGKVNTEPVWPITNPGDVYVMPVHAFEYYRKASTKMASLRSKIPPEKRGMRGAKNRRGFLKIVQVASPGIVEAAGAIFNFRVIYRDRSIFVCPGWEQKFDLDFFQERNYVTSKSGEFELKTGIVQNTLTGEYYYSLNRYLGFESTPVSLYSELRNWLRTFLEGMTHEQFHFMWQSARKTPTHEVHVPRGAATSPMLRGSFFSSAADNVLKNYLRPGQLIQVEEMLEDMGERKTRTEISSRSALLRRQLIAEGVYDIDQLPHTNYNAILGKRLTELKAARRKQLEEV